MANNKSDYNNIIITGSIAYDEIMDFPKEFKDYFHPEKLHQINVSFVVDKLEKQLGGTGTNIAYNISLVLDSRLRGNDKEKMSSRPSETSGEILKKDSSTTLGMTKEKVEIKLLGSIGKDGKSFLDFFKKNKIDTEGIIVDKKLYTAAGKVITDIKDNQIWGFYYGASKSAKKINLKKYCDKSSLLIISATHSEAFLHFQKEAIKYKVDYIYDPGMALTWITDKDLKEGVMNCRYLIGNDYEIAMILKRLNVSINQFSDTGICVITTLGEKGVNYNGGVIPVKTGIYGKFSLDSRLRGNDNSLLVPGYKVKKMVDPTGAGDAWRGGFIAGLVLGMKTLDCLKLGNVMASFAIEKYGTVNHKPNSKEVEKRMENL